MQREIFFFKSYFKDFVGGLDENTRSKINEVLVFITTLERIPVKFFKSIAGTKGLFEIRISSGGNAFRIFCCLDERTLIVLFNGFQKKTQKTPPSEIKKAVAIMNDYFTEQNQLKNGKK